MSQLKPPVTSHSSRSPQSVSEINFKSSAKPGPRDEQKQLNRELSTCQNWARGTAMERREGDTFWSIVF